MPTPPPRKRFQFHLSTAIVMMFVAGALMWANVVLPQLQDPNGSYGCYGWPVNCVAMRVFQILTGGTEEKPIIFYKEMVVNIWVAFTILYFTYRFCEWLIRRRAAQK